MRALVCGGRHYADHKTVWTALDDIHARHVLTEIIHGAARGADRLAADWAADRCIPCRAFHADWEREGARAGPLRNHRMLAAGPDLVIAFPGGRGTAHMVRIARTRPAIQVIRIP